ncbi:penicillin-binding protein 1C [bacterium]|nr:MAG: penicillin-binding protein 1C [bacterium]
MRRARRAACLLLAAAALRWAVPDPRLLESLPASQAVLDRDGNLLRLTLAADDHYRLPLRLSELAPAAVEAVLLQEDRWFYWHPGVNPWSLARGAWRTYALRGPRVGGSTVTMQAARRRWRIGSNRPAGKLVQVLRALQLELRCSKREILEYYLATMPLGGNVEGVGAASLIAFGKEARLLSVPEALALAVVPKSPARRRLAAAPGGAVAEARALLFTRWARVHPEDAGRLGEVLGVLARPPAPRLLAPHFSEAVAAAHPDRLVLRSTLDARLQRLVESRTAGYLAARRESGLRNAAVLLLDAETMEVRAALGSADRADAGLQGQVDGTRAKRSPGSALKPFAYALAFDQGLAHPATVLKDAPTSFGGFDPENFDRDFVGPVTAADALTRSRNVPAVSLASRLKDPDLRGFLARAGVSGLRPSEHYGLSIVLGGVEVTVRELAGLYAVLANGGLARPLRTLRDDPAPGGTRVLSREAAFMVLDALQNAPRPDAGWRKGWVKDGVPVAWKTGTSYGARDAWTAAVFGRWVAVVWIGEFDGRGNPAFVGVEAAAPLLFRLVDAMRASGVPLDPETPWAPERLERVRVCALSGALPGPHCRHTAHTWFIPGRSPFAACDVHREVLVDRRTGLRACPGAADVEARVYEFWPSDLARLFAKAGVGRRPPPAEDPACGLDAAAARGRAPEISSPPAGVTLVLRPQTPSVELAAVTDAGTRAVHWFAGERYLGAAAPGQALDWAPSPGRYVVRAVDDAGRASSREVSVEPAP